jgi:hypothetical protein
MSEVMDVINAFGTPLKLAWVGWLAWGVGQYFWFRHERSVPVRRVTSVAKPVAKKPAVPKTVAVQVAEAPVVGRLFTPTHVAADAKPGQPGAQEATQVRLEPAMGTPAPVTLAATEATMPVFDPAKAVASFEPFNAVAGFDPSNPVIEQFGAANDDNVLDKFVRDFEMQDARPRRRKPALVSETPSYGAEAPHGR